MAVVDARIFILCKTYPSPRPDRRGCGRDEFLPTSANSSATLTERTFFRASKVDTVTFSMPGSIRPT